MLQITFTIYRYIKLYLFMPLTGNLPSKSCRYYPTCSQYCHQAVSRFGLWKGSFLCFKRVARCHPFSSHPNIDPVPKKSPTPPLNP